MNEASGEGMERQPISQPSQETNTPPEKAQSSGTPVAPHPTILSEPTAENPLKPVEVTSPEPSSINPKPICPQTPMPTPEAAKSDGGMSNWLKSLRKALNFGQGVIRETKKIAREAENPQRLNPMATEPPKPLDTQPRNT